MKLGFAPDALTDLLRIGDYIAQDNRKRARTFVGDIQRHCRKAAANPRSYPVQVTLTVEVRRIVHGAYSIYFSVRPNEVRIERVVNNAENIPPEQLRPDPR